jgi:hypothetical protein
MTNPAHKNSGDTGSTYVQLTLGKTRLLFPGTEVLSLGAIPEIGTSSTGGSVGVVTLNEAVLPVYNFDEQLQLAGGGKDNCCACACLGNSRAAFGLLCDKLEIVDGVSLQIVALPACMQSANTPVQSLALQGTRILCVSSVERFAGLIDVYRKDEVKP